MPGEAIVTDALAGASVMPGAALTIVRAVEEEAAV
jgi:hypothetical protein